MILLTSTEQSLLASNTHSLPHAMPALVSRPSTKMYASAGIAITLLSIGALLYYNYVMQNHSSKNEKQKNINLSNTNIEQKSQQ